VANFTASEKQRVAFLKQYLFNCYY